MNGKQKTVSNTIRRKIACVLVLLIAAAMVFINVHASDYVDADIFIPETTVAPVSTTSGSDTGDAIGRVFATLDDRLSRLMSDPSVETTILATATGFPTVFTTATTAPYTYPTILTTTTTTTTNTGKVYALLGDVNWDGKILADDARFTLRISARLETLYPWALAVADVNGDGNVLSDDARQILRYSAKLQNGFERVVPVQIPVALTTATPTTAAPETTTVKSLNAFQIAWKNIASANQYISQNELINALGGANNAYQIGAARGSTNKLTPGSVYIYGNSESTNVLVVTSLNPDEIIYEVDLKDNTYATPEGLSVGDSVLSAKQLYGTPDREEKDLLVYNQDKPYHMMISVNSNGIITGISLRAKDD